MGTEKKAGDLEEIQVLEGISESEEIDRRVEELMAPEEEGNGKKKKKKQKQKTGHRSSEGGFHPVRRFKGFSRKRKIITVLVLAAVVLFGFSRMSGKAYGKRSCIRHRQRGCGVQYSCGNHCHECEGRRYRDERTGAGCGGQHGSGAGSADCPERLRPCCG